MKKILIAEDDKFIANAYRVKLEKAGFELMIAADGEEATRILAGGFLPDVVLLDLVMPKKDGFATLAEIKADEKTKNIPVVVASNLGQKEDIDRAAALGATDYITKTESTMEEIVAKINRLANQ